MFPAGGKGQGCTCNSFNNNCRAENPPPRAGTGLTDVTDTQLDIQANVLRVLYGKYTRSKLDLLCRFSKLLLSNVKY